MDKKNGLNSVTYSRDYIAEKQLPIAMIGDSRWFSDIELLLEDEWRNLKLFGNYSSLPADLTSSGVGLSLILAISDKDEIKKLVEAVIPSSVQKILILKESENPFLKKYYVNYATIHSSQIFELSNDAKSAAEELNSLLPIILSNIRTDLENDIYKAEMVLAGYEQSLTTAIALPYINWRQRAETAFRWYFPLLTLSSQDYKLIRLLVLAQPLLESKNNWSSVISDIFLPILSFSQSNSSHQHVLFMTDLVKAVPIKGTFDQDKIKSVISDSTLGILTKRVLTKNVDKLQFQNSSNTQYKIG